MWLCHGNWLPENGYMMLAEAVDRIFRDQSLFIVGDGTKEKLVE